MRILLGDCRRRRLKRGIEVYILLRNLKARDTRVIIISHNYEFVKESSSLICLKEGKLDRTGRTVDLLDDPGFDPKDYGVRFGSHH